MLDNEENEEAMCCRDDGRRKDKKHDVVGLKFGRLVELSRHVSDTYLATPDGSYLAISGIKVFDNRKAVVLYHDGSRRQSRFVADGTNVSRTQREYKVLVDICAGYHIGCYSFCYPKPFEEDVVSRETVGTCEDCLVLHPSAVSFSESQCAFPDLGLEIQ